jgi:hypothetical protein
MDKASRLKDLADLRDSGVLSEREFDVEKQKVLRSDGGSPGASSPYQPKPYGAPQPPPYQPKPYGAPQPPPYGSGQMMMDPPLGDGLSLLMYVASFLIPIAGFIIGAIYSSNNNPDNQKVGKNCLYISIGTILIGCLCYCILIFGFMGSDFGYFTCDDGGTIPMDYVYDGECDCWDCSDEG